MRYGAAGTGSPLHRSVKQTIALPEELNVSLVTSSILPPLKSAHCLLSSRSDATGQHLAQTKVGDFRFLSSRAALHARPGPEMA
jgi:hypothetical protein